MVQDTHTIQVTPEERAAILKHVQLPPGLLARLRFAIHADSALEFDVSAEDFDTFVDLLSDALQVIRARGDRRLLQQVFIRLNAYLDEQVPDEFDEDVFPPELPEEIRNELEAVLTSGDFSSLEEACAAIENVMLKHNQEPQDALLGLNLEQGYRLIHSGWADQSSLLHINDSLTAEELSGSQMLQAAIRLITLIDASDGLKLTARKNLTRKALMAVLDAEVWPGCERDDRLRFRTVLNEEDLFQVHTLHILLQEARLVRHYKGKLLVTRLGRQMLSPERVGSLQALLFTTMFRVFNLAYLDAAPEYPGVQDTIAFILYALRELASEQTAVTALADRVFLPDVASEFMEVPYFRYAEFVLKSRVLRPLSDFGMVEITEAPIDPDTGRDPSTVRLLPLFNKLLQFDL